MTISEEMYAERNNGSLALLLPPDFQFVNVLLKVIRVGMGRCLSFGTGTSDICMATCLAVDSSCGDSSPKNFCEHKHT